jgi:phosphohistidine phosphatase
MAERIIKKKIAIDAFISSTAKRAFTTANFFVHAYNAANKTSLSIIEEPTLYHAPPEVFYEIISRLNNELNTIAIFAHNPGITEFANELTNTRIEDMPTCGIFAVEVDTKNWLEFARAKKQFLFFEYPKLGV